MDANLKLGRNKLNVMFWFTETKNNKREVSQKQMAQNLGYLDSTFGRYRDKLNLKSPPN